MKTIGNHLLSKIEKAEDIFDTKLLRKAIKEYNQELLEELAFGC